MQGNIAVVVCCIHIGTGTKNQSYYISVASSDGTVKRSITRLVTGGEIGMLFKKKTDDALVSPFAGYMQGALSEIEPDNRDRSDCSS